MIYPFCERPSGLSFFVRKNMNRIILFRNRIILCQLCMKPKMFTYKYCEKKDDYSTINLYIEEEYTRGKGAK